MAYNAPHWPQHARDADIEKFVGRYDDGWEAILSACYALPLKMVHLAPSARNIQPWRAIVSGSDVHVKYQ